MLAGPPVHAGGRRTNLPSTWKTASRHHSVHAREGKTRLPMSRALFFLVRGAPMTVKESMNIRYVAGVHLSTHKALTRQGHKGTRRRVNRPKIIESVSETDLLYQRIHELRDEVEKLKADLERLRLENRSLQQLMEGK